MLALPAPKSLFNYASKGWQFLLDIGAGLIIGPALWIAATSLYIRCGIDFDVNASEIFDAFVPAIFPYAIIGVAFMIYVNVNEKPLLRTFATGIFFASICVIGLTINYSEPGSTMPKELYLKGLAVCYPLGVFISFIGHWFSTWAEPREKKFFESLGFMSGWHFAEWAGSVLTFGLVISIICTTTPGRIVIAAITAIAFGSLFKEWLDYRRTGMKSPEFVRSIIALKIGGPVMALFAAWILHVDYTTQVPFAHFAEFQLPKLAGVFCIFAIPTWLLAYRASKERKERSLAFCQTASAYWGIGAIVGGFIAFNWALNYGLNDALSKNPHSGGSELAVLPPVAIWTGFACCLAAIVAKYEIRPLIFRVLIGTYTAIEVIKVTLGTLIGLGVFGFFVYFILSSNRTDLHVFSPTTSEDYMYLGIVVGLEALIAFGVLEYIAQVRIIVKGPIEPDMLEPRGGHDPFARGKN